jgi:hypothetical protein
VEGGLGSSSSLDLFRNLFLLTRTLSGPASEISFLDASQAASSAAKRVSLMLFWATSFFVNLQRFV